MSKSDKQFKRVASVAPFNADGLLLFGRRRDSGKWTLPGGKLNGGEEPLEGAKRELEEEAGLQGQDLVFLGRGMGGPKGDIVVYSYKAIVEGDPDASQDPDHEMGEWKWVEPDDIPSDISENLHAQKNVTLRLLGLQPGEVEEPMQKKADPHFIEQRPQQGNAIRIPKAGTRSRKRWDADYLQGIAQAFTGGDTSRLRYVQVPTEKAFGGNMAVNKSRLALYKRMLKARDRLPPAVVRRNGIAYDLLDGNHRQQAHRDLGVPMMHAVEVLPYDGLKKGLPGLALAAGLSMGGAMPQQPATAPQPAFNEAAQAQGVPALPKWTPEGLTPEMYPIAHLESSWGKNLAHASNQKGEFHTAFGALGFKPVTAHDEYMKSPYAQKAHPGLNNPEDFLQAFKNNPKFYNLLASAHFRRLKQRHGGVQQAAYAWRWGTGSAANATPEQIKNDAYVQKFTDMKLDQLGQLVNQPIAKAETADDVDPLEAMLHHDDPRERMMALRSKHVTPYHLRLALQDEDPDVRAMAAKHQMMTSALIEEALKHPDLSTREAALSRPDLQDHHLEQALWDPDLQTQAALHPALTEEQRQKLLGNQDTPEGLKTELLHKSVGYVLYPQLDQKSPPTHPMIRDPEAHAVFGITSTKAKNQGEKPGRSFFGLGNRGFVNYNTNRDSELPPEKRYLRASVEMNPATANSTSMGNFHHETQHAVFAGLRQKYGREAGMRILATTLSALDPKDHEHFHRITDWAVQHKNYDPMREPEERIAYLQNYLQDGLWRRSAHKQMRIHMDANAQKLSHDWAKQIWKKIRTKAEGLTPQQVGVIRKDEELIGTWLTRKSSNDVDYNVYEDMLGLTPKTEAYLDAAKFLAHTEPDRAVFRRAMVEDFNLLDAALISVGMEPTKENQDALIAVIELQRDGGPVAKAEQAHEVLALMADGGEVAEGVRRGFGSNTEQELHLGGKHSKGSMMVRDPDTGQTYLLKPGSGGQSPAKGAKEERANQSRREAAFWHVAEAWGLNQRLPRADLLLIDSKEVAVLHMLPFDWKNLEKLKYQDAGLPHKALEKYRQMGELHKWAILDYVLGNPDRHGQNLMVGTQEEGYPIALIDHGSAFAGKDFDPARDKNSFIPYYLRAWRADSWGSMDPHEKLQAMPTVSGDTEHQLRDWFHGINAEDLEAILHRYGIDPAPTLARLARVKQLLGEPNFSEAVNRLWMAT